MLHNHQAPAAQTCCFVCLHSKHTHSTLCKTQHTVNPLITPDVNTLSGLPSVISTVTLHFY
ncbi:unnamed protein product [Staurois parvus]|uniref:Uncharacterized protein n=1 Tax=Staurois parvus TaxID=386267 RepID=A0ABN9C2I8_9NEOB|nr:unnamed protein product [Staurois parvus]